MNGVGDFLLTAGVIAAVFGYLWWHARTHGYERFPNWRTSWPKAILGGLLGAAVGLLIRLAYDAAT